MKTDRQQTTFDEIAAEFLAELQTGKTPTIAKYISLYPEHADQIGELFPMIESIEISKNSESRPEVHGCLPFEQLNDFLILGEIGRGGMGIVYEAQQRSLGRRVAIKVLPRQMLLNERNLQRFKREAKTAANLHHQHIVPVLGVGEFEGFHYYVMQFIDGAPLDKIIISIDEMHDEDRRVFSTTDSTTTNSTRKTNEDSVSAAASRLLNHIQPNRSEDTEVQVATQSSSKTQTARDCQGGEKQSSQSRARQPIDSTQYWRNVARIGIEAASALQCAHDQGILHRDIKPGNVIIDKGGMTWLADFGLAKAIDQESVSKTGDVLGTLRRRYPPAFGRIRQGGS